MKKNEWLVIGGTTNLGEDDTTVAGKITDDMVTICYTAYCGVKSIELYGIQDLDETPLTPTEMDYIATSVGDNWEVAFKATIVDRHVIVTINDCEGISIIPDEGDWTGMPITIGDVAEWDVYSYEDFDEEALAIFDY